MPRETIEIPLDEIGIICNTDAREQGEGAAVIKQSDTKEVLKKTLNYAVYSKNVDPSAPKGRLQPIKAIAITTSPKLLDLYPEVITKANWISKTDGTYTLVYDNHFDIKYVEDFYNSTALTPTTIISGVNINCAVTNNQELHIGTGNETTTVPKWAGYISSRPFGGIGIVSKTVNVGLEDIFFGGDYTGTTDSTYYVKTISSNKFQWKKNVGGTWTPPTGTTIDNTVEQLLDEGVVIWFKNNTGYTTNDEWTCSVYAKDTTLIAENAECKNLLMGDLYSSTTFNQFELSFTAVTGTSGTFDTSLKYRFKLSFDYDGYQESPLSEKYVDLVVAADTEYVILTIVAKDASQFVDSYNKRLTAINLYMAVSVDSEASGLESFKFIQKFSLSCSAIANTLQFLPNNGLLLELGGYINIGNKDFNFVSSNEDTPSWDGTDKMMSGFKINGTQFKGAAYEQITHRSDSLQDTILNYSLSCSTNGYHFVSKAWHTQIKELANHMLFRSDLQCYDCFNWSTNFLNLPFIPLQIAAFQSKVYVFGSNKILKVNIDLFIEETFEGVGITDNLIPLVTDSAMYWFDKNSIYMFDGKQILDIGISIKSSYSSSYPSFSSTLALGGTTPYIVYSAEKKSILFSYVTSISHDMHFIVWAWSLEKLEWYYWDIYTSYDPSEFYLFNGKDGEIYFNDLYGFYTYKLFASDNYLDMEFITKKYDMGLQNQDKKFYKIKSSGSSVLPTITYDINDGTSLNKTLTSEAINSSYWKAKNIQIKITSSAGATLYYLDTLELVIRQLIGMR